jgi:RNA polymerase-binding transcription factor DksA
MSIMKTDKYKKLLETERAKLLKELESIGQINPSNPADWEAKPTNLDSDSADENETADTIEEFEENSAILKQLEIQLHDVDKALEAIKAGTYGKCNVCGEEIPEARLKANPASLTCIKHTK